MIGTVDRVEGDRVVVLLEEDGEVVDQLGLPLEYFDLEPGSVVELDVITHPDETEKRQNNIDDRVDRLSERLGDDS